MKRRRSQAQAMRHNEKARARRAVAHRGGACCFPGCRALPAWRGDRLMSCCEPHLRYYAVANQASRDRRFLRQARERNQARRMAAQS